MEKEPLGEREPKSGKPERSVEAPSLIWWILAAVAIVLFIGLAVWLKRGG